MADRGGAALSARLRVISRRTAGASHAAAAASRSAPAGTPRTMRFARFAAVGAPIHRSTHSASVSAAWAARCVRRNASRS